MKANILKFALIAGAMHAATSVQAAEQPPQYAASCGACHAVGVAGAPKTGDAASGSHVWQKVWKRCVFSEERFGRYASGGLCNGCSDDDYKALITYMSTPQ